MPKMLILARGDGRAFFDLSGKSILADLPFETLIFVDKRNAHYFSGLSPAVTIEIVRWSDMDDLIERAHALHRQYSFFAVATTDEKMIDFAAQLRGRLGVPGLKISEASRFRNKIEMKQKLAPTGLRLPKFVLCADRDSVYKLLTEIGKIIIKPSDGYGSRSVVTIENAKALDAWFDNEKTPDAFEAEEFIDGTLYHVNAIVHDGQIKLTAAAPYLPGMANIDFASGTPFVTVMLTEGELRDRLEAFSTRAINALALKNGVTHLECFVTPKDEIVFCEIAIRPGGGGIVWMIEAQYGVNFSRATLLLEAGRGDAIFYAPRAQHNVAGLIGFRAGNGGIVRHAASIDAFHDEWIHSAYVDVKAGTFVAPSAHCTDYMALVVFSSKNKAEFEEKRKQLQSRFYDSLAFDPI